MSCVAEKNANDEKADSGLATFRGADGLWEGHRVEDVATPEAFLRDPALVHAFYDARREKLASVEPAQNSQFHSSRCQPSALMRSSKATPRSIRPTSIAATGR